MICISSNDAGGAEILSAWIKRNKNNNYVFNLSGPALKIFKKKMKIKKNYKDIKKIKIKIMKIITTTSKTSLQEINALKFAKKKKINSISILDHWVNYKERFQRNFKTILPNEIWVTDKKSLSIAKKKFKVPIKLKKNFYFIDEVKKIRKINSKEKKQILYVNSHLKNIFLEKKRILFFLNHINKIDQNCVIKIKPHPNDNLKKFNWIKKKFNSLSISISKKNEKLEKLIKESKLIVGCNSMAMVIAYLCKKKVYNALPPNDKKMLLPISIPNLKLLKNVI